MSQSQTYAELVNLLDVLPLESEEYKKVKKRIQELDFAMDLNSEFGTVEASEE